MNQHETLRTAAASRKKYALSMVVCAVLSIGCFSQFSASSQHPAGGWLSALSLSLLWFGIASLFTVATMGCLIATVGQHLLIVGLRRKLALQAQKDAQRQQQLKAAQERSALPPLKVVPSGTPFVDTRPQPFVPAEPVPEPRPARSHTEEIRPAPQPEAAQSGLTTAQVEELLATLEDKIKRPPPPGPGRETP